MPVWTIFFVWIWITHTWNLCKHCRYTLYYFVVYANYTLLCHWPIILSAYGYSPSSGLSALPAFGRLILWLWWAVSGRSRSCNRDVTMRAFTEPYCHHHHQQQYLKEADHATEMWPWEHSQSHIIIIIISSSSIYKKQIMQQRCDHESIHRAILSSSSAAAAVSIRSRSCNRDVTMRAFTEPYHHHHHRSCYYKFLPVITPIFRFKNCITESWIITGQAVNWQCNNQRRSRNHCCLENEISIAYSERVSAGFFIQKA